MHILDFDLDQRRLSHCALYNNTNINNKNICAMKRLIGLQDVKEHGGIEDDKLWKLMI